MKKKQKRSAGTAGRQFGASTLFDAISVNTLIKLVKVVLDNVARLWRNRLLIVFLRHPPYLLLVLIIQCLWVNVSVGSEGVLYSLNLTGPQTSGKARYGIPDLGNRSAVKFVEPLAWNPAFGDSDKNVELILGVEASLPSGSPNSNPSGDGAAKDGEASIGKELTHILILAVLFLASFGVTMSQADRLCRLYDWIADLPWRWRMRFSSNVEAIQEYSPRSGEYELYTPIGWDFLSSSF